MCIKPNHIASSELVGCAALNTTVSDDDIATCKYDHGCAIQCIIGCTEDCPYREEAMR